MKSDNLLELLNDLYNSLTKSEKKIANYLYSNAQDVQYMSITNLSERSDVAEATVFRFCKSLGFGGYNEFKLSLARSLTQQGNYSVKADFQLFGQVDPSDSYMDMCSKLHNTNMIAIQQTVELLDEQSINRATEILSKARRVYCLGQGASMLVAMDAWGRFLTVSPSFICVEDSHLQAMTTSLLDDQDAILFFSYSGSTKDMLDVLRPAKQRGTKVVLVTHFAKSPATAYADVLLLCGSNEGPMQQGSIAAKIAQLFVVDVLFNEYWRRNPEKCIRNNEITSNSIANKLL